MLSGIQRQLDGLPPIGTRPTNASLFGRQPKESDKNNDGKANSLNVFLDAMDESDDDEAASETSLPNTSSAASLADLRSVVAKPRVAWDYTLPKITFSMPEINSNNDNDFDMARLIATMQRVSSRVTTK